MKISDTPFFKTTPIFYQPLRFYGKSLNTPFLKIWKTQTNYVQVQTIAAGIYYCIVDNFRPFIEYITVAAAKKKKKKLFREYKFSLVYKNVWLLDVLLISYHWWWMVRQRSGHIDGQKDRWREAKRWVPHLKITKI